MITEWVTAMATSIAAVVGIITIGISVYKLYSKKKKNKYDVYRKLSIYMQWVNKTKAYFIEIFSALNNNLKTDEVMNHNSRLEPEKMEILNLEEVTEKIGYLLSDNQETELEEFYKLLMSYIGVCDNFRTLMLKEKDNNTVFRDTKERLRIECPKESPYDFDKTDDSEFSEYIAAYIKKLEEKWQDIKKILISQKKHLFKKESRF